MAYIELDCLKPQVGSDCILEGCPENETDLFMFKIRDVFGEPLAFLYLQRNGLGVSLL